jgi:hypothetical protein
MAARLVITGGTGAKPSRSGQEEAARAIDALRRHLELLKSGTSAAVAATMFLPELARGRPFEAYVAGMQSLAPLSLEEACVLSIDNDAETPAGIGASCMLDVRLATAKGRRRGFVFVWCLSDGRTLVATINSQWYLNATQALGDELGPGRQPE